MFSKPKISDLKFNTVTPKRWKDLENLFGERGACGGAGVCGGGFRGFNLISKRVKGTGKR
jgi:hypothetical protein